MNIVDLFTEYQARAVIRQRAEAFPKDIAGRMVVYTAIFGGKDKLQEVSKAAGIDYICFTDDEKITSKTWKIVRVKGLFADPRKNAKIYKILPHQFFKDYEYSLWVDGTHVPIVDVRYLVHRFLSCDDIALFAHNQRKCIYHEMEVCIYYNKAEEALVRRQERQYRSKHYPPNNGLAECTVILRRHNTPRLKLAMEDWWKELEAHTLRDQLSFNYVLYQHQLNYAVIPGSVRDNFFFKFKPHYVPDTNVVNAGWILNGTRATASARIMGFNVHDHLTAQGVYSNIFYIPPSRIVTSLDLVLGDIDHILNFNINILVLVKIRQGSNLDYLIRACRKRNIKLVYAVCDMPSMKMVKAADAVIANSTYFYKIIPRRYHHKLHIAFDGYEQPQGMVKTHMDRLEVKLVFVSNQVWDRFPCIRRLPEGITLKAIGPGKDILGSSFKGSKVFRDSPFDIEYVQWQQQTVYQEILEGDIAVIPWPQIGREQKVKSVNRLVMFMAMGIPVIASPIPSYLEIIKHGENGFIARTSDEWEKHIVYLRDNLQERKKIGENARQTVLKKYSKEVQGALYLDIFKKILKIA